MYLEEKVTAINMSADPEVACVYCWGTCAGKCEGCEGCQNTARVN